MPTCLSSKHVRLCILEAPSLIREQEHEEARKELQLMAVVPLSAATAQCEQPALEELEE